MSMVYCLAIICDYGITFLSLNLPQCLSCKIWQKQSIDQPRIRYINPYLGFDITYTLQTQNGGGLRIKYPMIHSDVKDL